MKIYDCFTFFNEIDLLKFRLEFLYDSVDRFVISESNITFSGQQKPFNFLEHKNEFSKWSNKIEYLQYQPNINNMVFDKPNKLDPAHAAWKIERAQRDFLASALFNLNDTDLVMLTDIDEIWNPQILNNDPLEYDDFLIARLEMSFYYFYMNCRGVGSENQSWIHPLCIKYGFLRDNITHGLTSFRSGKIFRKSFMNFLTSKTLSAPSLIKDAGWHFSYLGGADAVIKKIESFSHQELNNEKIKEYKRIQRCIDLGLDPFDRPTYTWGFYPIDSFPEKLANLMKKYPKFIKTSLI